MLAQCFTIESLLTEESGWMANQVFPITSMLSTHVVWQKTEEG